LNASAHENSFTISLPGWLESELKSLPLAVPMVEDRVALVIRLAGLNVTHGTGGPFAAGVFETATGRCVSLGVNRVVPDSCSSAHAEIVALSLAQRRLRTYNLGGDGVPEHELVVNWRPCAMCFGAIPWSGVRSLVIAGSGPEMEEITGFDEGQVPGDWKARLESLGISVRDGVMKEEALDVFRDFARRGCTVYNGRGAGSARA